MSDLDEYVAVPSRPRLRERSSALIERVLVCCAEPSRNCVPVA